MQAAPTPVQAYQLPDGSFVGSIQEYVEKMYEVEATKMAEAYVTERGADLTAGQKTRTKNVVKAFCLYQAAKRAEAAQAAQAAQAA